MSAPDPEQTIDGVNRRDEPQLQRAADPVDARDYAHLAAVERCHYAITSEIAKGGMGRIVEARDLRLGRRVAIKELLPKHRDAARRFEREARITARLQHPAIIHVYEAGVWPGGEPFFAMPRVVGRSLDKVVGERATLRDRLALLPNVIAVVDALAYAHSERVVHRDLKPSNVLVGEFGETVVIDWGLAKDLGAPPTVDPQESLQMQAQLALREQTLSGTVVGTPAYMAPEQARGDPVDERADVYALGALLYKVLVGHAPYTGASGDDVIARVKAGPPIPAQDREPGAPADLAAIVAKAMARELADRYAHAGELAQDLKLFQTGQLVAAHRYTSRQLLARWLRRNRVPIAIGTVSIAALAIVATVSLRRILTEKGRTEARRAALLEEQGRTELLADHPGAALAYLASASRDGGRDGARDFLIADAMRRFERRKATLASSGPVVAASPNGAQIATAGPGGIELWSAAGEHVASLDANGRVRALAWDDAGVQVVAAGDDGFVHVWTRGGGMRSWRAHAAAIRDVAFDSSGSRIVTASDDGTAVVWDVAAKTQLAASTCHADAVVSARFSLDGRHVVTASVDHTACVWDVSTGELTPLRGHTGVVRAAIWANGDQWIVTASDDGSARVWSAERGKPVIAPLRHDDGSRVGVVVLSHDGRSLFTAGSDRIGRIWRLPANLSDDGSPATARLQAKLAPQAGTIVAAAFLADDTIVATAADRLATLWEPEHGHALASFEHGEPVDSLAFAAHASLVTGSAHSATIWDANVDEHRRSLMSAVHAIAVARDGTIAAGTDNSRVTLLRGEQEIVLRGHLGRVFALAFTPDGAKLVSAGEDAQPIVWDVATQRRVASLGAHVDPVRVLAISPDGRFVVTADGRVAKWWTLDGALADQLDAQKPITALVFAPDGMLVAGTDDGTIVTWDRARSGHRATRLLSTAVTALASSPRRGTLLVAGRGQAVIVEPDATIQLDAPGDSRAGIFSRDGALAITAGDEGVVTVWDAATGKRLATRDARERAEALALAGDTLWLAGEDGTIDALDVSEYTGSSVELERFVEDRDPWDLGADDRTRLRVARQGEQR